jgi:hypothetical protein
MIILLTKIKYKHLNKINIHSDKFIRIARGAKIANLTPHLKSFTFFKKNQETSSLGSSIGKKDSSKLEFGNKGPYLFFLNQGLTTDDLTKLRSNLKNLGINITHIPTRF